VAHHPDSPLGDRNSSKPLLFDTNTMPPSDRLHRLRDAVGRAVVRVEIEHHTQPEAVRARCVGRPAAPEYAIIARADADDMTPKSGRSNMFHPPYASDGRTADLSTALRRKMPSPTPNDDLEIT
jgi:hypothetical protein